MNRSWMSSIITHLCSFVKLNKRTWIIFLGSFNKQVNSEQSLVRLFIFTNRLVYRSFKTRLFKAYLLFDNNKIIILYIFVILFIIYFCYLFILIYILNMICSRTNLFIYLRADLIIYLRIICSRTNSFNLNEPNMSRT